VFAIHLIQFGLNHPSPCHKIKFDFRNESRFRELAFSFTCLCLSANNLVLVLACSALTATAGVLACHQRSNIDASGSRAALEAKVLDQ
jgi:hypothetical protein